MLVAENAPLNLALSKEGKMLYFCASSFVTAIVIISILLILNIPHFPIIEAWGILTGIGVLICKNDNKSLNKDTPSGAC